MDSQLFRVALVVDSPRGVFLYPQSVDAGHLPAAFAAAAPWRSLDGGTVHVAAFPADDDAGAVFGMGLIDALNDDRNRLHVEIARLRGEAERLRGRGAMLRIAALAVAGFLGGLVGGWATTHAARNEPLAERARHAACNGYGRVAEKTPEAGRRGAGGAGAALGVERHAAGDGEAPHGAGVGVAPRRRVRAVEEPVEEKPIGERPGDGAPGVDIGESGIHGVVHAESVAPAPERRKNAGENAGAQDEEGKR